MVCYFMHAKKTQLQIINKQQTAVIYRPEIPRSLQDGRGTGLESAALRRLRQLSIIEGRHLPADGYQYVNLVTKP
jgi:hypothetical protein